MNYFPFKYLKTNFLSCFCCIVILFSLTAANVKLRTFKITDGVTVLLPKDFTLMSDDDLAHKYPSTKKPLVMFTNPDRLIDFGVNVSKSRFPGNDLKILQEIYKATILDLYQKVDFIQQDIKVINKRNYIVFEFTSLFEGQRNYSYLQYTLVKDQVYLFNFSSSARVKDQWQPIAGKIMNSIKMRISEPIEVAYPVKDGVKKYSPKKPISTPNK